MRTLTISGYDFRADRPAARPRWGRIVPKGMIGRVVPSAAQVATEGVP